MSSSTESQPPFKPTVPELTLPIFESRIPEHLLANTDDQMKWLLVNTDKNTQMTEFTMHAALKHNEYLRQLNGRVGTNEGKIRVLTNELGVIKEEAETMSSIRKVLLAFMKLWEYRVFRWVIYASLFFFFTYLLPWYIGNPPSLTKVFETLLGGK